jgi:ferrous iron transport protein B
MRQQPDNPPALAVAPPPRKRLTAALVGNPNTGKTTLFNALSGLNQRVGNYPGVTVETKKGQMTCGGRAFDLIDLPGTYSLAARSPDEMVAVDVILGQQKGEARPDVVVALADASNLERNLYLTTQALELGVPVVVALNMIDVAERQGLRIDAERLGRQLGVPVVPIQANKKKGLDRLRSAITAAAEQSYREREREGERERGGGTSVPVPLPVPVPGSSPGPPFPPAFEREVAALQAVVGEEVPTFLVRRLLLDVGGYTEQRLTARLGEGIKEQVRQARQRLREAGCPVPAVEARARYGWLREVTAGCVQRPDQRPVTWTDRLDRVLTHKVWGTLVFLALMFVVFQAIFTWSRPLMKAISDGKDWLAGVLRDALPAGPFTSLLIDGGLEGVGSVLVFLPQILILFGFIAVLEDCGYMARAAFLMDKLMARCGLSGKSFIPMLSSVACAVPGIMATRVIEDRRDRLATILVAPLMSCSARLPVYILLIGAFLTTGYAFWVPGLVMFAMYAVGLVAAPLVALALKRTLLRGETPVFVMEMPAYKVPGLRQVVRRMYDAGTAFVRRAGTLILASMVLVWALLYFPFAHPEGGTYPERIAAIEKPIAAERKELEEKEEAIAKDHKALKALPLSPEHQAQRQELEARIEKTEEEAKPLREKVQPELDKINELIGEWKKQSLLGRTGQAIEPAVRPLGWDWKIGVAALASFPAREVVVGTLGIIYNLGKVESDSLREEENVGETDLGKALRAAKWPDGRPVFTVPVALSLMVFFALCCQCASTLAVIRRETHSWRWPLFTFAYMTVLAYVGALVVYQVGRLFV